MASSPTTSPRRTKPEHATEYLLKAAQTAARAVYARRMRRSSCIGRALGFLERMGDESGARDTLLRLALTHHLAFDYRAAGRAFGEAFAGALPRPAAGAERAYRLGDERVVA